MNPSSFYLYNISFLPNYLPSLPLWDILKRKKKYEDELEISPFFAKNIPMKETQKILENVQMKVWL